MSLYVAHSISASSFSSSFNIVAMNSACHIHILHSSWHICQKQTNHSSVLISNGSVPKNWPFTARWFVIRISAGIVSSGFGNPMRGRRREIESARETKSRYICIYVMNELVQSLIQQDVMWCGLAASLGSQNTILNAIFTKHFAYVMLRSSIWPTVISILQDYLKHTVEGMNEE